MDVLIRKFTFLFIILVSKTTWSFCSSSKEFINTTDYLKKQKNFPISGTEIFKVALKISQNCSGASLKFQRMLTTLSKTGVDFNHSLQFAMVYSKESEEAVDTFLNLYQGLVLEKKFNLPYYESFEMAKSFAEKAGENSATLKKDFLGFLSFCFEDKDGMLIPLSQCRQLALKYIQNYDQFPDGSLGEFKTVFSFLRENKNTGLSISNAIALTTSIIENGPGAKENFMQGYKYGLDNLQLKPQQALALAMQLTKQTKKDVEKSKK